ncbi:MAG: hypothetical protein ACK50Q_15675 [Labrys sp. (in: a-proteobacteria)]
MLIASRGVAVTICAVILAGCASRAENIAASYASPAQYQPLSCPQIAEEAQRLSGRLATAAGQQNNKATGDAVATTVSLLVFWPAVFFVQGDGATAAEVARLKGEAQALEEASARKNCGIQFKRAAS